MLQGNRLGSSSSMILHPASHVHRLTRKEHVTSATRRAGQRRVAPVAVAQVSANESSAEQRGTIGHSCLSPCKETSTLQFLSRAWSSCLATHFSYGLTYSTTPQCSPGSSGLGGCPERRLRAFQANPSPAELPTSSSRRDGSHKASPPFGRC